MSTVAVRPFRSRPSLECVVLVLLSSGPETSKDRGLAAAEPDFVRPSIAARDAWVARNLAKLGATGEPAPGLRVLANNDPVVLNGRGEQPLRIAGKAYSRGLYCHAVNTSSGAAWGGT